MGAQSVFLRAFMPSFTKLFDGIYAYIVRHLLFGYAVPAGTLFSNLLSPSDDGCRKLLEFPRIPLVRLFVLVLSETIDLTPLLKFPESAAVAGSEPAPNMNVPYLLIGIYFVDIDCEPEEGIIFLRESLVDS